MPSLRQLIESKSKRLDSVPSEFVERAIAVQPQLLDAVIAVLSGMDITEGNFVISSKNLELIDKAIEEVRNTLLKSDYIKAVADYSNEFDVQKGLTDEALGFAGSETTSLLLLNSKRIAVDRLVKVEFVNEGLYDPIRTFLDSAVTNGGSISETVGDLRSFITGGTINDVERIGLLDKYAKQISYDAFAQADRQYVSAVADELELEWYLYSGGEKKPTKTSPGSRPFCLERNGKYWHRNEIKSWADLSWSGQIRGTNESNIFQFLGGWRCQHQLMPVSVQGVPRSQVARAIEKGYYEPDEQTRNLLNL